jgi:hypothetical protein
MYRFKHSLCFIFKSTSLLLFPFETKLRHKEIKKLVLWEDKWRIGHLENSSSRPDQGKKLMTPHLNRQTRHGGIYGAIIPAAQEVEVGGSKS